MASGDKETPCAVVWLHGMGGTGAVEDEWRRAFGRRPPDELPPACTWHFPRAPSGTVRYHGGRRMPRWCDTWGDPASDEWIDSEQDISTSVAQVHDVISSLDLPADRVLLGGFSQGGAIALLAALAYPRALAGCVVYGGWLSSPTSDRVAGGEWVHESNAATPIWWGHGARDRAIPAVRQSLDCQVLNKVRSGRPVEQRCFSSGHWPPEAAMREMLAWMRGALDAPVPVDSACQVPMASLCEGLSLSAGFRDVACQRRRERSRDRSTRAQEGDE